MIERAIRHKIDELLKKYPIISITGPRQSGKTTLCKMLRPDFQYVNLEGFEERQFAKEDPKGFLETYQNGVIIDEAQYVPELFSYLQVVTDLRQRTGEYILTGSQNFLLLEKITQSLAGRVAIFNLLPFSWKELQQSDYRFPSWEAYLLSGSYPRKIVQSIAPADFYDNYLSTYVERDVRQIKNISDLTLFQRFLQLLAGRVGQLFNQNSLGVELGLDNKTVNAWLSILETSFIAYRLPPFFENFSKRIVKAPKVYFYDTGLAAYLLGIRTEEDLHKHFAKGSLFENLVINELKKNVLATGQRADFYFWRDQSQHEIDLLVPQGPYFAAVEIKSGKTIQSDFSKNLLFYHKLASNASLHLIYGGNSIQKRSDYAVWGFEHHAELLEFV